MSMPTGYLAALVRNFYQIPGNEAGGVLHLVLDDGNLEDSSLAVCEKAAKEAGDVKALEIIALMRRMSMTQREDAQDIRVLLEERDAGETISLSQLEKELGLE